VTTTAVRALTSKRATESLTDDEADGSPSSQVTRSTTMATNHGPMREPGPDGRSWEQRYYSGRQHTRNWGAITTGIGLLVLISLLVPAIAVVFN